MYKATQAKKDADRALEQGNQLANVLTVIEAAARAGRLTLIATFSKSDTAILADLLEAGYGIEKLDAGRYEISWRDA